VHPIGGLRVHQFLAAAGQPARTRLRARTAAALHAQPDWPVIRATVIAWYESGFSLVRTAEALHVHRNTIVYRMTKIEQLAGHSLRAQPTTTALYLACLADQLDAGV
jgi:carbohydrate diacid regulator